MIIRIAENLQALKLKIDACLVSKAHLHKIAKQFAEMSAV